MTEYTVRTELSPEAKKAIEGALEARAAARVAARDALDAVRRGLRFQVDQKIIAETGKEVARKLSDRHG